MSYTQANRLISVNTPAGTDVLLLQRFSGVESISRLFRFELEMLALSTATIAFDSILGQSVTVTVQMPGGTTRYINGIVSRFSQGERVPSAQGGATFTRYRAELVPQFWLLTRNHQSRIFQTLAVPDILQQVLTGLTVTYQLTSSNYKPRDYCVQYRETDFDFASRLMEEEGIYYYFTYSNGSHTMIVGDGTQPFPDVAGATTLIYETTEGGLRDEERVHRWEKSQVIRSGKYRLWDYCFELPGNNLEAVKPTLGTVQVGTVSHSLSVGNNSSLEIYDYPGLYAQRFDGVDPSGSDRSSDVQNIFTDNARTVGIRMQEETAAAILLEGASTCAQLAAGAKFTLSKHYDGNGSYVLTQVDHLGTAGDAYTTGNDEESYSNFFQCIPAAMPYRPERTIPRPRIEGTQTAVVCGNSGDEIFTDKYGRIKVQFPWDRQGQNNADSSCWVRVATPWAGTQWGIIHIPRIGQEVVIAFEEGDPDRPIAVGSVYNANEMPPYTLADNMTQSGYLSRSTTQGDTDTFNQLQFEDKKGSEFIFFHAEKDFKREVENNDTLTVGIKGPNTPSNGDQTISIYNNRSLTVGSAQSNASDGSETITVFNNQSLTVGNSQASGSSQTINVYKDRTATIQTGNESLTVQQGNRSVTVSQGNDTHTVSQGARSVTVSQNDTHEIQQGNRAVTIDMGNDTLTIKMGNQTTSLNLGSSTTEAMQSITLKVGGNSITISQSGITISGIMVSLQGQAQAQVSAPMVQVSGSAMTQISGGITMIG